jgi:fructokinase
MNFKIIGMGEVLWDLLPSGRQMGGAPANFACHARALGAEARVISRVGDDELGRELISRLENLGVATDSIEVDPVLPTGTVSIEIARDGQPKFHIHENVAWDAIRGEAPGRKAVTEARAVCFGTLAQRSAKSRESIRSLIAETPRAALRILDVNLRQHYYSREIIEESLALANVLKISDAELPRLAEMFGLHGDDHAQLTQLAERFYLRVVAFTRGRNGSLLLFDGRWAEHTGVPTQVVDTIGAGDSFTAAMTVGLLSGWPIDEVNLRANEVAAFVCSQPGATPALPAALRDRFRPAAQKN